MIPRGLRARDLLERRVVRQQLAEDAAVAHAARDQLRVLAAVVEDEDLLDARRARAGARVSDRRRPRRSQSSTRAGNLPADRAHPTRWSRCSALPSVCSDGATTTSARLNSARSLWPHVAIEVRRPPNRLNVPSFSWRGRRGSPRAFRSGWSRRAPRAAASGGTWPCPSGSRGRALRRPVPAASRSSRRRRRGRRR